MDQIQRFRGALLGLAVGDALGARFEAQSAEFVQRRYPTPQALVDDPPTDVLRYTDDTQLAIAVAETLIGHEDPTVADYARDYVENYQPWRGYGRGARAVIEELEAGVAPDVAASSYFEDGSFGNGGAMRVAPVGLRYAGQADLLAEQARRSALPTHCHPLGVEGAVLLATAVGFVCTTPRFDRTAFFDHLDSVATTVEFCEQLKRARACSPTGLLALGNEISALRSVPTALAAFSLFPDSYTDAVGTVILLGGDTDTLAAMTGALSGAHLGDAAIPANLLARLEDDAEVKGRTYVTELAEKLAALR